LKLKNSASRIRVKAIYNALEELQDKVVFVGGAIVSFYADREIFEPRPTDDVDIIIEILNYRERAELEEKLRAKGFAHDVASGIVCRYLFKGMTVDIMPTDDPSVGFNTRWYREGFRASIQYAIEDHHVIRILAAPYFIAQNWKRSMIVAGRMVVPVLILKTSSLSWRTDPRFGRK